MQNDESKEETFRAMGLPIVFPFQGYGVQKSMMVHITRTLMNKENTLIESPTGTGKTLVLLCSTLAWLKKSKELERPHLSPRMLEQITRERLEALQNSRCSCGRRANKCDLQEGKECKKKDLMLDEDSTNWGETSKYFEEPVKETPKNNNSNKAQQCQADENKEPFITIDDDDDDDDHDHDVIDLTAEKNDAGDNKPKPPCKTCTALAIEKEYSNILESKVIPNVYKKIPKIYYGTRTHKQVSQVIRELNKTVYKSNLKMCILSSRERTCINESVRGSSNRDEACRELLKNRSNPKAKGNTCSYKTDKLEQTFKLINDEYPDRAWDIEEVNQWSREHGVCPYFGCRSLQEEADITFCPYNYLLDPKIRKSLNINLKNSIIIFDEAHNIEDICRESASFLLDSRQIDEILTAINIAASNFIQGSAMSDAYQYFRDKFYNLRHYLTNFDFGHQSESSNSFIARKVYTQSETVEMLKDRGLGPDCLTSMKKNYATLTNSDEGNNSQESTLDLSEVQYISQLTATLEFMYSDGNKNIDDYRCVITKSFAQNKPPAKRTKKNQSITESDQMPDSNYITQLSLLCMSPSIAFEKIHSEAWSVLVASGTLSPIESIQTELGCEFVKPFQGGHVIKPDRVIATVLSRGPNGEDLNCSFTNSMSLRFQDEVGAIVRDVCQTVPNGVLVFFPSYDRLDGLTTRWTNKGYMNDIKRCKRVFQEKRSLSPDDFELELKKYNTNANNRGALLFAVYRGKVSEGIDFADNAARAVITIGIPFPNVKEITIGLKRDYNDIARRQRPYLLPGRDWYTSQAFRALNQAVGRCIRHREDWGAIIMIDSRLRIGDKTDPKISKWLRDVIFMHNDYSVVKDCLEEFVATRVQEEAKKFKRIKLEDYEDCDLE